MLPPMPDDTNHVDSSPASAAKGGPIRVARRRQKSRGQSLVEFAVMLPLLVLILALAADFGRAFTAYITISSAAREGAAYGMLSTANSTNTAGIQAAALADAPTIWGTAPTVSAPAPSTDSQGYKKVSVTVNYTFKTLIPIPPIKKSYAMTRTVSMRVIN